MSNLQQFFNKYTTAKDITIKETDDKIIVKQDSAVYCAFAGRKEEIIYLFKVLQTLNNKYDLKTITIMNDCLSMCYSTLCYSMERNIDKLLQDKYIAQFEIGDDIKKVILKTAIDSIFEIKRNIGEDGEGCGYNSLILKPCNL